MTVASEISRSGPYIGNGVTTIFNYEFRIVDEDHLRVIRTEAGVETVLVIDADYGVSGVGEAGGGQIAIVDAPTASQTITILRNVPFTQETDLENQGAYYAETVEAMADLSAMRDQQLGERIDRAVTVPASSSAADLQNLIANVLRLSESAENIDTVAGIAASVSAVAAIDDDVATVAAIDGAVVIVAGIADSVVAVADVAASVVIVANNIDSINTVAADTDLINKLAGLEGDVVGTTDEQELTNKILTSPEINGAAITGGTVDALTRLGIRSTGSAHDILLASSEGLTADRTLSLALGDANRSMSLGGNLTIAAAFLIAGAFASTLTLTEATNVTLPTTGTLATLAGAETFTNKTLTDPRISRIYGGNTAGSSLTFAATSHASPSGDSIHFQLSGLDRGGFGGSVFSPWVFALKPNSVDYRFAVNDLSTQIGYDVILLGGSQFDSGALGTPNQTWKAPRSGFSDVAFGGILGNNITGSNHAFMIIAASPGGVDNPLEFYTNNGAGSSIRRAQINGGAAIAKMALNGLTLELSNNTAVLPSISTSSAGMGVQIGMADGVQTAVLLDSFAANSALMFRRANTTALAPSAVQANDNIGFIGAAGYRVSDYSPNQVAIALKAEATWTGASTPTKITFETTPIGSTSRGEAVSIDAGKNLVVGTAAIATTATNGFPYIPSCPGAPTGVPTAYAGRVPLVYDSTNNRLYAYNSAWKSVVLS